MKSDPETGTVDATEPSNATTARGRFSFNQIGIFRIWRQHAQEQDDQPIRINNADSVENLDEKLRPGYPAYSSFLGQHSGYQTFRRFRTLRMRMILLKQDEISKLELHLEKLDREEKSELFLGSCRFDRNKERKQVFKELDDALAAYDSFVQRSHWALHVSEPSSRELGMQQVWLWNKNYIARNETAYINSSDRELMNIGLVKDQGMASVARAVGFMVDNFYRLGHKYIFAQDSSGDPFRTITISNAFIRNLARLVAASLAIILLLVPIIILNAVTRTLFRFIVLFISSTLFVAVVTVASQATLGEIFAAGAAYTAVLVVFVSGNGVSGTPAPAG